MPCIVVVSRLYAFLANAVPRQSRSSSIIHVRCVHYTNRPTRMQMILVLWMLNQHTQKTDADTQHIHNTCMLYVGMYKERRIKQKSVQEKKY